jgi:hypothetical protein
MRNRRDDAKYFTVAARTSLQYRYRYRNGGAPPASLITARTLIEKYRILMFIPAFTKRLSTVQYVVLAREYK